MLVVSFAGCSSDGSSTNEEEEQENSSTTVVYDKTATIDLSQQYQTIEGFGASDCWTGAFVGEYWTSYREDIAKLLFSQDITNGAAEGAGLSMWRVNLGAGTAQQGDDSDISDQTRRGESYLDSDGSYNWSRCVGSRFFLSQAKSMGCSNFVLFSNSPLVELTKNGKGYSTSGGYVNMDSDNYDDYAQYVVNVLKYYRDDMGVSFNYFSPANEPQYDWSGAAQEGTGWQNSEIANFTKELNSQFVSNSISTKILLGEAGDWEYLYSTKSTSARSNVIYNFFDPASSNYIGDLACVEPLICAHSYWTDGSWTDMREVRASVGECAEKYGLRLWQSEWSMLGNGYSSDEFVGYDSCTEHDIAMYMSRVIHNDLTVASVSSWSYWVAMDMSRWSHMNRFLLIKVTPSGGAYSDASVEGSYTATKTLWVLGNYSNFIRPGYIRLDLSTTESRSFFGSAWISPSSDEIVVVYTNYSTRAVTIGNTFANSSYEISSVTAYETTETIDLKEKVVDIDNIELSAESVRTLVYKLK